MEKYNLTITSKKGTSKYNGVTFGKLMYELNRHYLKYDHRTLDEGMVKTHLMFGRSVLWCGGGSKLNTLITKEEVA